MGVGKNEADREFFEQDSKLVEDVHEVLRICYKHGELGNDDDPLYWIWQRLQKWEERHGDLVDVSPETSSPETLQSQN